MHIKLPCQYTHCVLTKAECFSILLAVFLELAYISQDNEWKVGFNLLLISFTFTPFVFHFASHSVSVFVLWRGQHQDWLETGWKLKWKLIKAVGNVAIEQQTYAHDIITLKRRDQGVKPLSIYTSSRQRPALAFKRCCFSGYEVNVNQIFTISVSIWVQWVYRLFLSQLSLHIAV